MKRHHVVVGMIAKIPRSQCIPLKKVPPSLDQRIGGDGSVLDLASSVPLTRDKFFVHHEKKQLSSDRRRVFG
jgi:hypothetical protein